MLNCAWWIAMIMKPSAYMKPTNSAPNFTANSSRELIAGRWAGGVTVFVKLDIQPFSNLGVIG